MAAAVHISLDPAQVAELHRELTADLERIKRKAARIVARYVDLVYDEAQRLAPELTGRLKREMLKSVDELIGSVAEGVFYGRFTELGTSRITAKPHLAPAWEKYRNAFEADMKELLDEFNALGIQAVT